MPSRAWWFVAVVLALVPGAVAHGGGHRLADQLVESGQSLMLGEFDAPQPGALVVLPRDAGPLDCDDASAHFRVGLANATVALALNATHLRATFAAPPNATYYGAFGLDTNDAVRALILMQEKAVALHALGAVVSNQTGRFHQTGYMGVPYDLPVEAPHKLFHEVEGRGILLDYPGHAALEGCEESLLFARANLSSLEPGRIVHAVALFDPDLPYFLPRPIDESTSILQLNLYLTRPGEDPDEVARALDAAAGAHEIVPGSLLLVGIAAIALPLPSRWTRKEGGE